MSREIGDEFEDYVSRSLEIKKTANSGAMFNNGDMVDQHILVECKVKNGRQNFTVDKKEFSKLKKQAEARMLEWVYIQNTHDGDAVLIDFNFFVVLYKTYKAFLSATQGS